MIYPNEDWFMEEGDLVQRIKQEVVIALRRGPTLCVGMNLRIGGRLFHIKGVKYGIEEDGVVYKYSLGKGRRRNSRWFPIGLVH